MNRVQRKFVLEALDQEHKLTEKTPDKVLTDKQNEILNRIQRKLD